MNTKGVLTHTLCNITMDVKLIPLIELPTFKYPELETIEDSKKKQEELIKNNYSSVIKLASYNNSFYNLTDVSLEDLEKAIKLHVSDMEFEKSCALFGGYALKVNANIVLYPQCCGLLSEINDWKKILKEDFQPFYLTECHPSPKFTKTGNSLIIECDSSEEPFQPKTESKITLPYKTAVQAIENVIEELNKVSKKLDLLNSTFKTQSVSKQLIWEE